MSRPRYFLAGTLIAGCLAIAANAAVVNQVVNTVAVGGITGLGTGIATALGINVGSAGAPVLFNGAGGTPSSIVLSNGTNLPVSGLTGLGTGVATALGIGVGSAGAPVTFNGALGTPSSGTGTNITGIPNAGLTNSAITIMGVSTSLGGSFAPVRAAAAASNVTGTTTTASFVMGGIGATNSITPASTGRVKFTVTGNFAQTGTTNGCQARIRYGTGSAPANAAAETGTQSGSTATATVMSGIIPFTLQGYVTGLAISTAVWIDIAFQAVTGGTCTPGNVAVIATEL